MGEAYAWSVVAIVPDTDMGRIISGLADIDADEFQFVPPSDNYIFTVSQDMDMVRAEYRKAWNDGGAGIVRNGWSFFVYRQPGLSWTAEEILDAVLEHMADVVGSINAHLN